MENSQIFSYVDHTLLKATASWIEIQEICDDAVRHETASVCVPPSYVSRIKKKYGDKINICTVIGFPLGYSVTAVKVAEALAAIADGASEIDMVINIGDVKNGEFDKVTAEISALKKAVEKNILKVIIETCYLTDDEKIKLCECVTQAGADYIKTSTGFGTDGAAMRDILLFKENIGPNVKIKAAGGIKNRQDMVDFIDAGCSRLGTSSAVKILAGETAADY